MLQTESTLEGLAGQLRRELDLAATRLYEYADLLESLALEVAADTDGQRFLERIPADWKGAMSTQDPELRISLHRVRQAAIALDDERAEGGQL